MNSEYNFTELHEDRMVYVRPIDVDVLPDEIREQAKGRRMIYAVHNSNGDRLALVHDRDMAFALARQNNFAPVNVH